MDAARFESLRAVETLQTRKPAAMKFFVDTADTKEIADLAETGLLDGVTTNPSLVHKSGRQFLEVVKEIAGLVEGPVSAEVVATEYDQMMKIGRASCRERVCQYV